MLVKNLHGTSDNNPPAGYSSWLSFWEDKTGRKARECCRCGSYNNLVGAHVQKVYGSKEWYIVPLCSACNKTESEFDINIYDMVLVNQ